MEDHSGGGGEEGWSRESEWRRRREDVFEIHFGGRTSKILARDLLAVMCSAPC